MKNKAFTLIELLGVIIILGVIALVITPLIDNTIKRSQEKLYKSQMDNLISSVKSWTSDNKILFTKSSVIIITLQDLKENNYISYEVKNPKTDACLSNTMQFKIEKNGKKYSYSIIDNELKDGFDSDCVVTEKSISIYLMGENPYNLEINTNYNEPGITALDVNGSNLDSIVTSKNNINKSVLGTYQVIYEAEKDGNKATKIRNVVVVDTTAPTIIIPNDITISKDATTLNLKEGVRVVDNSGANIEVNIVGEVVYGVPGTYNIKYVAVDPSGNIATELRMITVNK